MRESVRRSSEALGDCGQPLGKRRRVSQVGTLLEQRVREDLARSLSFLAAVGIDVVGHRAASECYSLLSPTSLARPLPAKPERKRLVYPTQAAISCPRNKRTSRARPNFARDSNTRKSPITADAQSQQDSLVIEISEQSRTTTPNEPILDGDVLNHLYTTFVQPTISGLPLNTTQETEEMKQEESLTQLLLDGRDNGSGCSTDSAPPAKPRRPESKVMLLVTPPTCALGRRSGWLRPRSVDVPAAVSLRPSPRLSRQRRESEAFVTGSLSLAELSGLQSRLKQVLQQAPALGAPKAAVVAQSLAPLVLNKTLTTAEYLSLVQAVTKPVVMAAKRREMLFHTPTSDVHHFFMTPRPCARRLSTDNPD